jgi:hypothetical protein
MSADALYSILPDPRNRMNGFSARAQQSMPWHFGALDRDAS